MAIAYVAIFATPARAYEVKRTSTGRAAHWEQAHVQVSVSSELHRSISFGQGRSAARRAASAWSDLDGPELVVANEPDERPWVPGQPGTQITVQRPWPHAQSLLATTVTTYEDASGRMLDADVLLNPSARLTVDVGSHADRWDLQALLTHELGHVLGLGESDDDARATMWPTLGAGETHQRTLTRDDRNGIAAAYAGVDARAHGCGRASVSAGPAPPLGFLVALLLGLVVWMARRRSAPVPALAAFFVFLWIPSAATRPNLTPVAEDARWVSFAGATELGVAHVRPARIDPDGVHRTRVQVGETSFDVLGGCVDGVCQRFGETVLPVDGERVLVAPATGAWAHVWEGRAHGGWLGHGPALPLSDADI